MKNETPPLEALVSDDLKGLIQYCEKTCVAECCGFGAFDFSPLHVASYLSCFTGTISGKEITRWERILNETEILVKERSPDEDGFIGSIPWMNQHITKSAFISLISELRHSIQVSPEIVDISERLRMKQPNADV